MFENTNVLVLLRSLVKEMALIERKLCVVTLGRACQVGPEEGGVCERPFRETYSLLFTSHQGSLISKSESELLNLRNELIKMTLIFFFFLESSN